MPTREIAWNAGELGIAGMYLLMAVQGIALGYGLTVRLRAWRQGQPLRAPLADWGVRLRKTLGVMFLHQRLIRPGYLYAGIMHLFIFWGFLMLFVGTLIVLLEADIVRPYFGLSFYQGTFYVGYKLVINFFGLLFIVGLLMALYRRYGQKPVKFRRSLSDDAIVLGLLLWLGVGGFTLQALRLAATQDPAAPIHWVSYPLALALWHVDRGVLTALHSLNWWAHMVSTTLLIVYLPASKLLHLFTGPANVFVRATEPKYLTAGIANIEEQEHFGADKPQDFNWKQLLGTDACMRCGRCLDYCPTFTTGKPLKPRQLIIETSAFLARESGLFAGVAGPRPSEAGVRGNDLSAPVGLIGKHGHGGNGTALPAASPAGPTLVQVPPLARFIGDIVSEEEIWDCTTCRACMEQCPVLIEHVPLITELRRHLVLEQSQFPSELQGLFTNLERNGNPYSFPASTRADWAHGLDVPLLGELPDPSTVEVLYWVGCMSSFDARTQQVAKALVRVLQAAGVTFAILGVEETCCGDPARRAGNEYLYQVLAQGNIETLNGYQPKRIVANCPHCFNTLKNEYPELGGRYTVVSHTELLQELLAEGRLPVDRNALEAPAGFAYHDPCYLGRYNQVYAAPRQVLIQIETNFQELPRHHDRSFCCGAGGARAFMEEKRGTRISHNRLQEALDQQARGMAVACPFCITMFEDGAKGLNQDETFAVRDVAELVAAKLDKRMEAGASGG